MKQFITYIKWVVFIIVTAFAVDARYLSTAEGESIMQVQQQILANQEVHNLKHQEDVLKERYFDLERRYGAEPTNEQRVEILEAELAYEQKQKEVNKELGMKEVK